MTLLSGNDLLLQAAVHAAVMCKASQGLHSTNRQQHWPLSTATLDKAQISSTEVWMASLFRGFINGLVSMLTFHPRCAVVKLRQHLEQWT